MPCNWLWPGSALCEWLRSKSVEQVGKGLGGLFDRLRDWPRGGGRFHDRRGNWNGLWLGDWHGGRSGFHDGF